MVRKEQLRCSRGRSKRHGNACIATQRDRVCIEEESAAADARPDVGQLGFDARVRSHDRSCIPAQPRVGYRVGEGAATPLRPVPWPELSGCGSERAVGVAAALVLARCRLLVSTRPTDLDPDRRAGAVRGIRALRDAGASYVKSRGARKGGLAVLIAWAVQCF
jgi:hypothetical protein